MLEVLKDEIFKWIKGNFTYAIFDSSWVSLVYMIPKKTRITIEKNEQGEEECKHTLSPLMMSHLRGCQVGDTRPNPHAMWQAPRVHMSH